MINGTWVPPKDTIHDDNNRTVKAWITYRGQPGWYTCNLILENGYPMYSHLCSSVGYATSDLWTGRKERQERWKQTGLKLHIVGVVAEKDLPQHVFDNNKNDVYVDFVKKYFPEHVEIEPEVVVEAEKEG